MRVPLSESCLRWSIPLARSYIRYGPFPAAKRAFWTRVVEPHLAWKSWTFVASTDFGSLMAGNTQEILQQYIYYFGIWEPLITRWLGRRLTRGATFVDVGANIGYYSLLAAQRVGTSGRVVAIEASPKTFRALRRNLRLNTATNVRAVNVAVSARSGKQKLFHGPAEHTGLTSVLPGPELTFECEVETAPLDAVLRPEELRNLRVLKIDVEGAEWEVAAGMEGVLHSCPPDLEILLEVHVGHLARQGRDPADLLAIFRKAGFHAYVLENDYSPLSYLSPTAAGRALRLRDPLECETNLLLSRQDRESL